MAPFIKQDQELMPGDASDTIFQLAMDALTDHIAILDKVGRILAVNAAWKRFATENGAPQIAHAGLGINYLDICRRAARDAADPAAAQSAREALYAISQVLDGLVEHFAFDYPCHAPDEQRWFRMHVAPLGGELGGVVVSHVNITSQKKTDLDRERLQTRMHQLSISVETLTGLLPICGECRQPTSDPASWDRLGQYLASLPSGSPKPGLCPSCQQKKIENKLP